MEKLSGVLQSIFRFRAPLAVSGLIIICVLLILLQILQEPIFAPIGATGTLGLLSLIVRSVFWLAVVSVVVSGAAYVLPPSIFIPPSRVEYAVVILRMFDPFKIDKMAQILDGFEPYVGFPYYSRESNHSSFWPPRFTHDRLELGKRYEAFFGRDDVQLAFANAKAASGKNSSVQVVSSGPGPRDPDENISQLVTSARMFFNSSLGSNPQALVAAIGEPLAREFLSVETARNDLRQYLPNRIAVLRIHNAGTRTARNVTIDYEVAGYIYDTKVRIVAKGESEPLLPFEHRLTIPQLLPDQTYDLTVWYIYQSVDERMFPDKINFIQEVTQGFTISNIAAATGARVTYKEDWLAKIDAYDPLYKGDGHRPDDAALAKLR